MGSEIKRRCGYRKVGGTYLVGECSPSPCDRLPIPVGLCPVCGQGVEFSRGWTQISPDRLLSHHEAPAGCLCDDTCPACHPPAEMVPNR